MLRDSRPDNVETEPCSPLACFYAEASRYACCILVEREVEAHTTMRTHHALQAPCCACAAAMRRHHLSASNSRSLQWTGGSPAQQACPAPWRSRHTGPPSSGPACRGTTSARKYKLQPFKFATSHLVQMTPSRAYTHDQHARPELPCRGTIVCVHNTPACLRLHARAWACLPRYCISMAVSVRRSCSASLSRVIFSFFDSTCHVPRPPAAAVSRLLKRRLREPRS